MYEIVIGILRMAFLHMLLAYQHTYLPLLMTNFLVLSSSTVSNSFKSCSCGELITSFGSFGGLGLCFSSGGVTGLNLLTSSLVLLALWNNGGNVCKDPSVLIELFWMSLGSCQKDWGRALILIGRGPTNVNEHKSYHVL